MLHIQKQLSIYHPKKMLGMDLVCPFVIKRTRTKIKTMWHDLSSSAPYLGHKSLGGILKKYLYKNKKPIFRNVAVLEPTILLKMVFSSQVFINIFMKLFRTFFLPKQLASYFYAGSTPSQHGHKYRGIDIIISI